uniref:Uncharacterized protein n=1 Tax=Coccidioides posadasii RMSCC 3488 TaxID=454284 RepID=A0A0J6EW23_COCPO|nr:hypothetical protein CPAG_01113 [Coccidioides posadasii RMSCC 3488]
MSYTAGGYPYLPAGTGGGPNLPPPSYTQLDQNPFRDPFYKRLETIEPPDRQISTENERVHAVTVHSATSTCGPSVDLYDGPTNTHPVLATATADKSSKNKLVNITVPRWPGYQEGIAELESITTSPPSKHVALAFSLPVGVGKEMRLENFEWRMSTGNEIKEQDGQSYGWKLVRMSNTMEDCAVKRSRREFGVTSDGKEVVAVLAYYCGWSMTKGFKFAFLGGGLTGTMGEKWEIVTLVSALHVWYMDFRQTMAGAALY